MPIWIRILPPYLRTHLEGRSNLQKILANSSWLFIDRIVRLGFGLFISIWIARYFGPSQFGLLNYSLSVVAIFSSIAGLGLSGIIVRDLVREPQSANTTIGTSFSMLLVSGILSFSLLILFISITRPSDTILKIMVIILGLTIILKVTDVVKFWFESQIKSKYIVIVENSTFLIFAAVKVFLVLNESSILALVWTILAESILLSILLLLLYSKKVGSLTQWSVKLLRAKQLIMESWPIILVSASSVINMRMDQVILGTMVSDNEVGNYAAAVRVAEVWLVIPGIIGASIYPALILAKENNFELYKHRVRQLTKLMAVCVIPLAIIVSLFADSINLYIYGDSYVLAGKILTIYIWTGVPYLIFFVLNQMFYIEGLLKYLFITSILSIFSTVGLNMLLIPHFGGTGAAVANLITATGSTIISLLILNFKTRIFWNKKI